MAFKYIFTDVLSGHIKQGHVSSVIWMLAYISFEYLQNTGILGGPNMLP